MKRRTKIALLLLVESILLGYLIGICIQMMVEPHMYEGKTAARMFYGMCVIVPVYSALLLRRDIRRRRNESSVKIISSIITHDAGTARQSGIHTPMDLCYALMMLGSVTFIDDDTGREDPDAMLTLGMDLFKEMFSREPVIMCDDWGFTMIFEANCDIGGQWNYPPRSFEEMMNGLSPEVRKAFPCTDRVRSEMKDKIEMSCFMIQGFMED